MNIITFNFHGKSRTINTASESDLNRFIENGFWLDGKYRLIDRHSDRKYMVPPNAILYAEYFPDWEKI